MKKSDLKELIRNSIIKELSPSGAYRDPETFEKEYEEEQKYLNRDPETGEIDDDDLDALVKELEYQDDDAALGNMYSPLYEKKKDEEEDIEITADEIDTTEEPSTNIEDPALSDAEQEYLNTLEILKNKAKEMGDEKLENQIDNTITYFTRQHVVKEGDTDYARAKDAKRLGTKGEKNIYGAGVKKGEEVEKKRLQKEISVYPPEEMDNLVNLNDVKTLVSSARNIIKTLKNEGFDEDDIYDFVVDKITTLDDGNESLMENVNRKEAQYLKKGDIITSGEEIVSVSSGAKTPSGKIEVTLKNKQGKIRTSIWGKTTKIGVKDDSESLMENHERRRLQVIAGIIK